MMRRLLTAGLVAVLLIACSEQDDATITVAPSVEVGTVEATLEVTDTPSVESTDTPTPTTEPTLIPTPGTPQAIPGTDAPASFLPDGAVARLGLGRFEEMAVSPDKTRFAVATSAGIHVFDTATFEPVWSAWTDGRVLNIDWSPDGVSIAIGVDRRAVIVYDAATGTERWRYEGYVVGGWPMPSMKFGPDGQLLATVGCIEEDEDDADRCKQTRTNIWSAQTGALVKSAEGGEHHLLWSPDGRYLTHIPYARDVWDTLTGQHIPIPNLPEVDFNHFTAISPDFTMVAFNDEDSITIAEWPSGTILYEFDAILDDVMLAWYPDSSRLLLRYTEEGDPEVLEIATGSRYPLQGAHPYNPSGPYFEDWGWSADGRFIATEQAISTDDSPKGIGIWDAFTGEKVQAISSDTVWYLTRVEWIAPQTVLTLSYRFLDSHPHIAKFDAGSPQGPQQSLWGTDRFLSVDWSPDGQQIATGGFQLLSTWDIASQRETHSCSTLDQIGMYGDVNWLDQSGGMVAAHNWLDLLLNVIDVDTCEVTATYRGDSVFSPDGSSVLRLNRQKAPAVDLLNPDNFVLYASNSGNALTWSPDHSMIAAPASDKLYVWDTSTGRSLLDGSDGIPAGSTAQGFPDKYTVAWSPDSTRVAALRRESGTADEAKGILTVVDVHTGDIVYQHEQPYRFLWSQAVTWLPDGEHVAIVELVDEFNVAFSIHNTVTGTIEHTNRLNDAAVSRYAISDLVLSQDGRYLITAFGYKNYGTRFAGGSGSPGLLIIWDLATGEVDRILRGHAGDILDLDWSPDGRTLASASADGTVILWDIGP